jgi:hypothetical protein
MKAIHDALKFLLKEHETGSGHGYDPARAETARELAKALDEESEETKAPAA